ncbi:hypothetical protein NECAME_01461 [Necator americanus]|uniref:Uncharacterized protein n=1 Tax=Necator americanus TaxID=51031 RepID=W2TV92_NECAM|nr:hypothetical protein NECAME_01461 [Necator americanus]ETN85569.1 hypothetical protein NECAME_01461 [Necator americanus]
MFRYDCTMPISLLSNDRIPLQPTSVEGLRLPNVEELRGDVLIALSAIHSMYPFPGIRRRFQQRCKAMRQLDKVVGANIGSLTARQLHFV